MPSSKLLYSITDELICDRNHRQNRQHQLPVRTADDKSDKFDRKEKLATEYLRLLDVNNPSEEALNNLEGLLIEFSDDPAFVAKLKLEKLIKLAK